MKQCLECLGPEIRCEKDYGHFDWHRSTGTELITAWSSRGTIATIPVDDPPEITQPPPSPRPRVRKPKPKPKPARLPVDPIALIRSAAELRRDHYDDIRARQRTLAGIPEDMVAVAYPVPEHTAGFPCGRSIGPKQVPWVDRDWNG